jgi:hypothetical protein
MGKLLCSLSRRRGKLAVTSIEKQSSLTLQSTIGDPPILDLGPNSDLKGTKLRSLTSHNRLILFSYHRSSNYRQCFSRDEFLQDQDLDMALDHCNVKRSKALGLPLVAVYTTWTNA